MAQDDDKQRTKRDRIERLRRRLDGVRGVDADIATVVGILKGVLDILADEL